MSIGALLIQEAPTSFHIAVVTHMCLLPPMYEHKRPCLLHIAYIAYIAYSLMPITYRLLPIAYIAYCL